MSERKVNKTILAHRLEVSRSSLYYKPKLSRKDEMLREKILGVLTDNPSYEHRRVALALGDIGLEPMTPTVSL